MTMFGLPWPPRCCQRRFMARPASMHASLEPVVEQPMAADASGACHSSASIRTHRSSSAAVRGYSSLSIMFLSKHSAMRRSAVGSIHVVTNVAMLRRAFPSSMSSSCTIWYATSAANPPAGIEFCGTSTGSATKTGLTATRSRLESRFPPVFAKVMSHTVGPAAATRPSARQHRLLPVEDDVAYGSRDAQPRILHQLGQAGQRRVQRGLRQPVEQGLVERVGGARHDAPDVPRAQLHLLEGRRVTHQVAGCPPGPGLSGERQAEHVTG